MSIHIIAEACTNHDGDLDKAKTLAKKAMECGADSVKFQLIYPELLYVSQIEENGKMTPNPVIEQRRKSQLSDQSYYELADYCKALSFPLSASVFDSRGLDLLDALDPPYIKLASCDINNLPLLALAAQKGRTLIISSGMAELKEIEMALDTIAKSGSPRVVLLHCVSVYPTPLESTNLSMIPLFKKEFGVEVGFSDHTKGHAAACAALALGATWFEKHYTLDVTDHGFDHAHSTPPHEFAEYVSALKTLDQGIEPKSLVLTESELQLRSRARRGLYAVRDMQAGEVVSPKDILIVRPEASYKASQSNLIVGKKLLKPLKKYQPFSMGNVS